MSAHAVEAETASQSLSDDTQIEHFAEPAGHLERRIGRRLSFAGAKEIYEMIVGLVPWNNRNDPLRLKFLLKGDGYNLELLLVMSSLKSEFSGIYDRTWSYVAGMFGIELKTFRKLGIIALAVVSEYVAGRRIIPAGKVEAQRTGHWEKIVVSPFRLEDFDFRRKTQLEKLMGRVYEMCTPVTECSHTKVIPAAPVALMEFIGVVVIHGGAQPGIPVHALRKMRCLRESGYGGVVSEPPPFFIHKRVYPGDVLDDARFSPHLELRETWARMSLIAHLSHYFRMLSRLGHQELILQEGTCKRFLAIHVYTFPDSSHTYWKVRMVRSGHDHGIKPRSHLIEQFSKISVPAGMRILAKNFRTLRSFKVHVAESDDIHHTRCGKFPFVFGSPVTDADEGNVDHPVLPRHR